MSDELPPIPSNIWDRLLEFLRDKRTGRVALNISQGRVLNAEFSEQEVASKPTEKRVE